MEGESQISDNLKDDIDKSDSSSFEDLSVPSELLEAKAVADKLEELDAEKKIEEDDPNLLDILGNGELIKKIIKNGEPDSRPLRSDLCKINIQGRLKETNAVIEEDESLTVQIGDAEVIQGLDLALPLMNIGEVAEITMTSRFGYGEIGLGTTVPPKASLVYDITLLSSKPESDLENSTIVDRKIIGNKKRERGNWWYSRGEHSLSIQSYRRALEYLDEVEGGITDPTTDGNLKVTDAELQSLLEDRVKVYNNMAQAQMKIQAWDAALKSLNDVLRCQPLNIKALYRKGLVLSSKNDVSGAIATFQKALSVDPTNKSVQQEIQRLQVRSQRDAKSEKNLYKKMLGQPVRRSASETDIQQVGNGKTKIKAWSYLAGSVLVGLAGVAVYRYKYM